MNSFAALIQELGSQTEIASALGVGVQAVSNMKARNSVSPMHWHRLVELASAKELDGITIEKLTAWYVAPSPAPEQTGAAA